jgi:hypothetical protein
MRVYIGTHNIIADPKMEMMLQVVLQIPKINQHLIVTKKAQEHELNSSRL